MPLTRGFKETIQARVRRDPAFRKELLRESVECFVLGDVETGKAVLRDYINATVGFAELADVTQHSAKKPDADAESFWQPAGTQSVRNCRVSSAQRESPPSRSRRYSTWPGAGSQGHGSIGR